MLERYETDLADINRTRKEITQKAKSEAQLLLGEANARIENTIRQIKEAQAEKEKTRTIRAELKEFRERLQTLESESIPAAQKKPNKKLSKSSVQQSGNQFRPQPYTAGMSVRLKDQSTTGVILEIQDKLAIVAFGNLKSTVQLSRLEPLSQNQLKKEQKKIHAVSTVTEEVRSRKLSFKSEIDLRGMRADEALQAVTYYIDDALMVGISAVRILHGTGTGALRQIIRQYLSTVPGVKQFRDEHVQFGGAGITVVDLEE